MFQPYYYSLLFTAIVWSLAALVQVCTSSPPLYTCATIPHSGCMFGNQLVRCPSVCSYFFDAIENALVNDKSSLYTLQRAFFPDGEQKPNVVDIYTTLILDQVIDVPCDSEFNIFRNVSTNNINDGLVSLGGMDSTITSLCSDDGDLLCYNESTHTVTWNRGSQINASFCKSNVSCSRKEYRWHHVWSNAVLTNVIERESLGLISSINSVAYIT